MTENIPNTEELNTFNDPEWWADFFLGVILGHIAQGQYEVRTSEE